MDIFLKSIGIITLVAITFVALYIYLLWRNYKQLAKTQFDALEMKLEAHDHANWTTFAKAKFYEQEILSLGFKPINIYSTTLGIDLWVFINDDFTQAATITNTIGEQSMEFSAVEEETLKAIDVTDNPSVSALSPKPYKISIGRPDLEPKELYALFLKTINGRSLEKMPPKDMPTLIESQFAKEMTQLVDSGGLPEEDIDNLIELYGESLTDEQRDEFIQETKMENLERRWEKCIDIFSESQDITPKTWNQYEGRMIVVSDDDDLLLFKKQIVETLGLDEEEESFYTLVSELKTSKEIILTLQEKLDYHKIKELGNITEPLQARIYGYEHPEATSPYL